MDRFKNEKFQILADQALFSGTSFVMTIWIAQHLELASFGIYSAYILILYLIVSSISAWTIQVFQVANNKSADYISFMFWFQILLTIVGISIIGILAKIMNYSCSFTLLLFGFGFVMYDFGRKLLLSLNKTSIAFLLDLSTSLLLLSALFIFQIEGTKDLNELIEKLALAYFAAFTILFIYLKVEVAQKTLCKSFFRKHISQGKWLFFTAVSQWWAGNLFVVASGIYLGAAALGALRLAQTFFGILNILLQAFENYVLPQTAKRINEDFLSGIHYLRSWNIRLAWIFIPVLTIIFIFSKDLLLLAGGPEYSEYAYVMQGLSILYVFIYMSQPLRFVFRSLQLNHHFFYAYLMSLGFALVSSHWLLSTFGLYGVLIGLTGSQFILMMYWSIILQIKKLNVWKSFT